MRPPGATEGNRAPHSQRVRAYHRLRIVRISSACPRELRVRRRTVANSTNASMRVFHVLLSTRSRTGVLSGLSTGSAAGASGAISSADMLTIVYSGLVRLAGPRHARVPLVPGTRARGVAVPCRLSGRCCPCCSHGAIGFRLKKFKFANSVTFVTCSERTPCRPNWQHLEPA